MKLQLFHLSLNSTWNSILIQFSLSLVLETDPLSVSDTTGLVIENQAEGIGQAPP